MEEDEDVDHWEKVYEEMGKHPTVRFQRWAWSNPCLREWIYERDRGVYNLLNREGLHEEDFTATEKERIQNMKELVDRECPYVYVVVKIGKEWLHVDCSRGKVELEERLIVYGTQDDSYTETWNEVKGKDNIRKPA